VKSLALKPRWWNLGPMIALPLVIMAAVLLLIWTPGWEPSSRFAVVWPYVLALGAGTPFAWRLLPATSLVRAVIVLQYLVLGALALLWFTLAFNCARGLCP